MKKASLVFHLYFKGIKLYVVQKIHSKFNSITHHHPTLSLFVMATGNYLLVVSSHLKKKAEGNMGAFVQTADKKQEEILFFSHHVKADFSEY